VTGSSFVLFDPHRHFVQGDTGERMDFVEDRIDSLSPDKSALASCFKLFGNDMQSPFSGTLFRFPLRSAALAQYSEISSAHYDGPSMLRLFRRFITEASNDCLFLKFVRRISLEVWEDKAEQPATLFKVEVSARGPDLANRSRVALESLAATAEYSYTLTLRQTVHDALAERLFSEVPLGTDQPEAQALPRGESEQEWLFAAYCDVDGPARQYVEDIQETKDTSDLRMVPWACVAWPRPHATREAAVIEGRAYCFLPLPVITGLLPHLNSFWELSSNRRDLWKGDNMGSEASKIRGQWNTILKQHVVAPGKMSPARPLQSSLLEPSLYLTHHLFTGGLQLCSTCTRRSRSATSTPAPSRQSNTLRIGPPSMLRRASGGTWSLRSTRCFGRAPCASSRRKAIAGCSVVRSWRRTRPSPMPGMSLNTSCPKANKSSLLVEYVHVLPPV
jgi:sacsin